MFSQFPEGMPVGAVIPIGVMCVTLALARVVRNLPRNTVAKFFEHRTTKYRIIADDSKGRVVAMQKQRLMFLAFALTCLVVVALTFIISTDDKAELPRRGSTAPAAEESRPVP
ncbi:hypothetical protein [Streptomyces sp. NPDC018693]|uniref:hypothetical protein n=1 Tax=unclassified Streptomyces TaxID=2593676 RepID=UPI00379CE95D